MILILITTTRIMMMMNIIIIVVIIRSHLDDRDCYADSLIGRDDLGLGASDSEEGDDGAALSFQIQFAIPYYCYFNYNSYVIRNVLISFSYSCL